MKNKFLLNKTFVVLLVVLAIVVFIGSEKFETGRKNSREARKPVSPQPVNAVSAQMSDKEFTAYTLRVFQPLTSRKLTDEDARQITQNTVEFFRVRISWEKKV